MKKWIPLLIAAPFLLSALFALKPRHDRPGTFALREFGRLPVLTSGRVQPLDSLARNSLLQLHEKQSVKTAPWEELHFWQHGVSITATQWLLEMMTNPAVADTRPVFRIDHPQLKSLLGLPEGADAARHTDGKDYAWNDVRLKLEELQGELNRVSRIDAKKRDTYEQAVTRLGECIGIYMKLQNVLQPQNTKAWGQELNEYLKNVASGVAAVRAQQAGKDYDKDAFELLLDSVQRFDAMGQLEPPMLIPPPHPETSRTNWMRTSQALMEVPRGEPAPYAVLVYARMSDAFREGRIADFNQAVVDYRTSLATSFEKELSKCAQEQFFNAYSPFVLALSFYLCAALCIFVYWLDPVGLEVARKGAFGIVLVAFAVHLSGLLFRMLLEGRPPVTNLYSSAIFIGVGACFLGIILELFWRNAIGLMVSSSIGFITLIIAHHLSLSGDTMEMMRAVLDSNFWLATHVVVVTLGYASTFVAGFLAILYIILGVFTPVLARSITARQAAGVGVAAGALVGGPAGAAVGGAMAHSAVKKTGGVGVASGLTRMVYAIVCFATLFSFVGTVLGGIWADQSWGRFWGWDPKENGALLIVLWNALVLHARWGGLVKERGLMNLVIFGNVVTAWSWFGVNMLGIGLHSYGFMGAAFWWLSGFVASQLLLILIGLVPRRFWRSETTITALPQPLPA